MPYKVICLDENYNETFDDCVKALIEYNNHNRDGHSVSLVPVGGSTYDTFNDCLNSKGVYNGVFRISQNPLGLSYNIPTGSSFNVQKTILGDGNTPAEKPPKNNRYNFYFEKLVKLIPSEIIGLYLALYAVGLEDSGVSDNYVKWIVIICFFLVFISRIFGTKISGYNTFNYFKTAQWGSIIISAISFIIWVHAMGHTPFIEHFVIGQTFIKAAVIIWTFIVPMIYNGDK